MNIQTLFSLSKQGKRDLYKTTLFTSIHQLSVILPVILLIMLTDEMISHIKIGEPHTINLWKYIILSLTLLTLIYMIYLKTYQQMYVNSGKETAIMRIRLAEKFRKLPLSYLSSRDLSDFTSTLMDDVSVIEKQLTSDFANLIAGIVSSMVTLIVLSFYNWQMSAILFLIMPIALLFIAISKFATAATNKKNRQLKLNISEALQEYLENIKVIKSSNQKEKYIQQLKQTIRAIVPWSILYEILVGLFISISYNIIRMGLGIMVLVGTVLLVNQQLSILGFILFVFIAVRIYDPLTNSLYKIGEFIYSLVSAKRIKDIFDIKEQGGSKDIQLSQFDIHFNHVSFGYNKNQVIHDVTLFNDTVFNNIKVGNYQATDEEIYAAAKMANCQQFIDKLPEGYQTIIGENGQTLSGGERQRISIARAFLKQAPIILLDEATSSLDPENETLIQEAISKLIQDKTVIVIAHRLKTIEHCDQIIVLKDGKIVEKGKHQELMSNQALYQHLVTLQRKSSDWKVNGV